MAPANNGRPGLRILVIGIPVVGTLFVLGLIWWSWRESRSQEVPRNPAPHEQSDSNLRPDEIMGGDAKSPRPRLVPGPPADSRSWFADLRQRLYLQVDKVNVDKGRDAAYQFIVELVRKAPADFSERVRRAYAVRFLPSMCAGQSSRRPEVQRLIEGLAFGDPDPLMRSSALAVLFDYPAVFVKSQGDVGYWHVNTEVRFVQGSDRLDLMCLGLTLRQDPRLRSAILTRIPQEDDSETRRLLIRLLASEPDGRDAPALCRAALADPQSRVRHGAIEVLSSYAGSQEAHDALWRAADTDVDPHNRVSSLYSLARVGESGDTLVSRLLDVPSKDAATYESMGRVYASNRSPRLAELFREGLLSESASTRANAVAAIEQSRDAAFEPFLITAIDREAEGSLKKRMRDLASKLRKQ